jgi:type IV pilus assembly protein PilA
MSGATGLRYVGTDQFELEASDYNWMPRLLVSSIRARAVFLDIRDMTPHLADEMRLSYLALGVERCIFLTDTSRSDSAWIQLISHLVGEPDGNIRFKIITFRSDAGADAQAFVSRAKELLDEMPAPQGVMSDSAVAFLGSRVPPENCVTTAMEREWPQVFAATAIVNVPALFPSPLNLLAIPVGWISTTYYVGALWRISRQALRQGRLRRFIGGPHPALRVAAVLALAIASFGVALGTPIAIAVPQLLRARMSGNEISAIGSIRAIVSAQAGYASTCGNGGYAPRLTFLNTPAPGTEDAYISPELGSSDAPVKSGYNIALRGAQNSTAGPLDCHGRPTVTDFYASASPQVFGTTGSRSFAATSTGELWEVEAAAAPAEPFTHPSRPLQ